MTTTFSVAAFKNKTVGMLTGYDTSATPFYYVNPYNGTQTADPTVAPTGSFEFAAYSSGPNLNAKLSMAGGGISQLTTSVAPTTPANALTTSSITTARIYNSSGTALMDVTASTAGGGGGIILDSLNASAGIGSIVQAFSFKFPANNGGTMSMNAPLVNRMTDLWCGGNTTVPSMGNTTGGACALMLYSGAAPSNADQPATGTLLAQINMSATNIWNAAAVGGAVSLTSTPSAIAVGTGTIGYARLVKTYGTLTFVIQGAVGTTTGSADFVLNTLATTAGVTSVQLNEASISI